MEAINRREFVSKSAMLAGGLATLPVIGKVNNQISNHKTKLVLVGTGVRGLKLFGKVLLEHFGDQVEYVGLCDHNPGRLQYAKEYLDLDCDLFTDFDEMISKTNPEYVIVTTTDSTHDNFIIKALNKDINVITEKPITTDEFKASNILEAERKSRAKIIVTLNYRWGEPFWRLKELLLDNKIGKLLTIDFNWYLNVFHGASYFRRWHAYTKNGGTLLVHKSTHHFDLLNWWIGSDPVEVFSYGGLDHYGKNGKFRGDNCRTCSFKKDCKFHWDITQNEHYMGLYVNNEHHDDYIRDSCVFREDIDIYDRMGVQIRYANGVQVNYSLNAYLPYEGHRVAFNGTEGRIENEDGIPWLDNFYAKHGQEALHAREMSYDSKPIESIKDVIHITDQFDVPRKIEFPFVRTGHWGGDLPLLTKIFEGQPTNDRLGRLADSRAGVMAVLIGVAARKSIESGRPIRISDLTDLV